ncbi:DUF6270 domain-containing protein [Weissella paramesenteroides]|uniref:DUF6270 domain-containing protein n=1 Tax=Weissella paramesenteroides TaxID=1249 RepID=UPI00123C6C1D|nr:DUF6270 domain-containing protein [Weissella paramesenteroides]KAA8446796.1 hypothetical protein FKV72_03125 [Weissella paramesenteroides]KAA8454310.1 hypothetical protein FKV71_00655 [Weissella paramesenteroides]
MALINVGVIGSCVSRDSFNSRFNSGYKEIFNCKLSLTHISIPSFISSKINYRIHEIDHKSERDREAILNELNRDYMEEFKANKDLDYLILDFWTDVFFGSVVTQDGIFTNNKWRVLKTKFYSELTDKNVMMPLQNEAEYLKLWKQSLHDFVLLIKKYMPNTKIIINKARAVNKYISKNGEVQNLYSEYDRKAANRIWEYMDDYCINKYHFDYIDVCDPNQMSYEDHPWGKYMVHYTKDYYEKFIMELASIAVTDIQEKLFNNITQTNMLPNLIDNSNFEKNNIHWFRWNPKFKIESGMVTINNTNLSKNSYDSVLSNPIKIKRNKNYSLSFKIYIFNDVIFDSYKSLMTIRLFKNTRDFLQKDAVWYANLKYDEFFIENQDEKWLSVQFNFKAKYDGFLKLGPSMSKNGHVSWKDICLTNDLHDNSVWRPSYRDVKEY